MTPERKAIELVSGFITSTLRMPTLSNKQAKACAIILCDEIIGLLHGLHKPEYTSFFYGEPGSGETIDGYEVKEYWQQVKSEIEKL